MRDSILGAVSRVECRGVCAGCLDQESRGSQGNARSTQRAQIAAASSRQWILNSQQSASSLRTLQTSLSLDPSSTEREPHSVFPHHHQPPSIDPISHPSSGTSSSSSSPYTSSSHSSLTLPPSSHSPRTASHESRIVNDTTASTFSPLHPPPASTTAVSPHRTRPASPCTHPPPRPRTYLPLTHTHTTTQPPTIHTLSRL